MYVNSVLINTNLKRETCCVSQGFNDESAGSKSAQYLQFVIFIIPQLVIYLTDFVISRIQFIENISCLVK